MACFGLCACVFVCGCVFECVYLLICVCVVCVWHVEICVYVCESTCMGVCN